MTRHKPDPGWPGHHQTDPACLWYAPPHGRISKWWHKRMRGRSCPECRDIRAKSRRCKVNAECILVEHPAHTRCMVLS